jgi:hypothetical protein
MLGTMRRIKNMSKLWYVVFFSVMLGLIVWSIKVPLPSENTPPQFLSITQVEAQTLPWWEFQSIDTMKYSRDRSREYMDNPEYAQKIITRQISAIAQTGATHVGIATPYDAEFLPILKMWVAEARKNNLKIWYRGNWSGWEEWFDYPAISREEHLEKTISFIEGHPELFEDGDAFTACPECENGGPGDPRMTQDVEGHRKFLIDEHVASQQAFKKIKKQVQTNLLSMNGDVANATMDPDTTQAVDGLVTVDHYVETPQQLAEDIQRYAEQSEGRVVLGEMGAPIPDINGRMTTKEQAEWLDEAFGLLAPLPELSGINYWVNVGGSTELWDEDGKARPGVEILTKYFKPKVISGLVVNDQNRPLAGVVVTSQHRQVFSNGEGIFHLPVLPEEETIELKLTNYESKKLNFTKENYSQIILTKPASPDVRHWLSPIFDIFR